MLTSDATIWWTLHQRTSSSHASCESSKFTCKSDMPDLGPIHELRIASRSNVITITIMKKHSSKGMDWSVSLCHKRYITFYNQDSSNVSVILTKKITHVKEKLSSNRSLIVLFLSIFQGTTIYSSVRVFLFVIASKSKITSSLFEWQGCFPQKHNFVAGFIKRVEQTAIDFVNNFWVLNMHHHSISHCVMQQI